MRETAELIFTTSLEGKRTIRVPNPLPIINQTALNTVVGRFLYANPFNETVGNLEEFFRADRVNVDEIVLI